VELIDDLQANDGAAHVTDLAKRLGVSHVTVHKTIKRLKSEGFVNAQPYRAITLTESGRTLARESRERHEITFRFLQHLGLSENHALNDAEGIEHHVSPALLQKRKEFCRLMESNGYIEKSDLTGQEPSESPENGQ